MGIFDAGRELLKDFYDTSGVGVLIDYARDNVVLLRGVPAKITQWYMYRKTAEFNVRSHNAAFKILSASMEGITPELRDVIIYNGREYLVIKGGGDGCWEWTNERTHDEIRVFSKYSGVEQVRESEE